MLHFGRQWPPITRSPSKSTFPTSRTSARQTSTRPCSPASTTSASTSRPTSASSSSSGTPPATQEQSQSQLRSQYPISHADGLTPLIAACKTAQITLVKNLIENGAKADLCSSEGKHPLEFILASRKENYDVADYLISNMGSVLPPPFRSTSRSERTPPSLLLSRKSFSGSSRCWSRREPASAPRRRPSFTS